MGEFWCDRCGKGLLLEENVRYVVKLEVFAAYDTMELTRREIAETDHAAEIQRLITQLSDVDPNELQDQVHRRYRFDLCPPCQRWLLAELREQVSVLRPEAVGPDDGPEGESDSEEDPSDDAPGPGEDG